MHIPDILRDKSLEFLLAMLPEDFQYQGIYEVSYFYLSYSKRGCACVALKECGEDDCIEVWISLEHDDERLAEHGKTPREAVIAMLVRLKKYEHVNF